MSNTEGTQLIDSTSENHLTGPHCDLLDPLAGCWGNGSRILCAGWL